ncbi:hypothetical protein SAMN05444004_105258 [Jannaschia faecimaris]|uniref:Uncharacterized protein n=1 Tax=Jannaschia faecimaris TaxID=1244108 RepID=A0A1H3Q0X3_9RHOB|nr:hypothetical protein SAMN05444004_105258 [Jannaschia faecimaris]
MAVQCVALPEREQSFQLPVSPFAPFMLPRTKLFHVS